MTTEADNKFDIFLDLGGKIRIVITLESPVADLCEISSNIWLH